MNKKVQRLRRAKRTRAKIKELCVHRLTVHRTPRHIYAQIIEPEANSVITNVCTLDPRVKKILKKEGVTHSGNAKAARIVGKIVAENAKAAGLAKVAFDRSGFKYHGRVKALAEAAKENGLTF